jgi:PAS domain-containing protein
MVLTDARLPDHPIVFANRAFPDLTGHAEAEVIGRNCRFLQCPWTDAATIR